MVIVIMIIRAMVTHTMTLLVLVYLEPFNCTFFAFIRRDTTRFNVYSSLLSYMAAVYIYIYMPNLDKNENSYVYMVVWKQDSPFRLPPCHDFHTIYIYILAYIHTLIYWQEASQNTERAKSSRANKSACHMSFIKKQFLILKSLHVCVCVCEHACFWFLNRSSIVIIIMIIMVMIWILLSYDMVFAAVKFYLT